jgi:hypothetical protein
MTASDSGRQAGRRSEPWTIEKAPVRVDAMGRLSVDVRDLMASKAFHDNLQAMVELAEAHPPARRNRT